MRNRGQVESTAHAIRAQDFRLAWSCKTRHFCPSCHQKRMLAYGEWLENNVLAPAPHCREGAPAAN